MDEMTPGVIQKLDETVINRIAAGEVIQRPANALKELMENSLDAGANNIQVVVKSGGMKLLQIQDDGSGIRQEDLPIVCERFTTSKLQKFEDLQSIGTYGFRGEALASISHVAHLSIITKTNGSQCAYKAEYADGKLKEYPESPVQNPKPCAGKQGTIIVAEDLFYNMETRRRALKNALEEHNKIAEVITRYAVHNSRVGFSFKKFGETRTEIRTPPNSSVLDNIKILYGASIARELVTVSCDDAMSKFHMNGYVSNVNYSTKKLAFILFINHRLVDSSALRKSVEAIYSNYLPKGSHPFIYLSIELDPKNVDVNVHPTKHEVHFLHEDTIVSTITSSIENTLLGSNESRTFFIQSLLPGATGPSTSTASAIKHRQSSDQSESLMTLNSKKESGAVNPKNMVRTDAKSQKLDRFLTSTPNGDMSKLQSFQDSRLGITTYGNSLLESCSEPVPNASTSKDEEYPSSQTNRPSTSVSVSAALQRREIRLRSVRNMRNTVTQDCHEGLLNVFRNHSFVGCADRSLALFQHDTSLYVSNTFKLSTEMFYQKLVFEFGNFGKITIEDPIGLKELTTMAFEMDGDIWLGEGEEKETVINEVYTVLMGKRKMLDDYFSLTFDEKGYLTNLPMLLDNYFPSMEGLPNYIMSLAKKVDWANEQRCFESFCHQTALFYAIPTGNDEQNLEEALNGHPWKWNIEHIVYPEMKKSFLPPKVFAEDSTIVLLTTLPELYKVFERC